MYKLERKLREIAVYNRSHRGFT